MRISCVILHRRFPRRSAFVEACLGVSAEVFLVIISRTASGWVAMAKPTFRTGSAVYPGKVYSRSDTKTNRQKKLERKQPSRENIKNERTSRGAGYGANVQKKSA